MAKIKLQLAQAEADQEIKQGSLKLERAKLELGIQGRQGVPINVFDVSKHVKHVPPFSECDVETYLHPFEKMQKTCLGQRSIDLIFYKVC